MNVQRGANYAGLNLSGPHSSALINEVEEEIIVRLDARNAWVDTFNALNPEPWAQQARCTYVCFSRYQRDLIVRWRPVENCWELDGLVAKAPDNTEGDCAAEPDEPPNGSSTGGFDLILTGGFHLPEPERAAPRGRRRPPADQAAAPPAKAQTEQGRQPAAAAKKRKPKRVVLKTRVMLRRVRRSPRFRHMLSQIEVSVADMKALCRLTRNTIGALAYVARRKIAAATAHVRNLFIEPAELAPEQAYQEPRRIEIRPGFTLVLYNFDGERPDWDNWLFGKLEIEFDYPDWESWLFGRPVNNEQKVA